MNGPIPTRIDLVAAVADLREPTVRLAQSDDDDPETPHTPAWYRREAAEREERAIPRRYRDAQTDHPDIHAWVSTFVADPHVCPSLLIDGPTGTGKTHAAFAALRLVGQSGRYAPWHATTTTELFASLRPRPGGDSAGTFETLARCPLLFLDDLGTAKGSEWTEETLFRLVDRRYAECLPSIFTTNVPTRELAERLGERIASRLAETTRRVTLTGTDWRRRRPS